MKEIILEESVEKAVKRISRKINKAGFFTRCKLSSDGEYYGKVSGTKAKVFMLNPFFNSFLAVTLFISIEKKNGKTTCRYRFARPLFPSVILGFFSLLFLAAGFFSITEDIPFALCFMAFAIGIYAFLFIFPKKTKQKLLSIIDNNRE